MVGIADGALDLALRASTPGKGPKFGTVTAVSATGQFVEATVDGWARCRTGVEVAVGDSVVWLPGRLRGAILFKPLAGSGETVVLPTGSISGSASYFEQFDTVGAGAAVLSSSLWELYDGPGNAGFGIRAPGQIEVVASGEATSGSNVLQITAEDVGGQHYSGGLKLLIPRTYGQFELRVKVEDDADEVTSGVVLAWPTADPVLFPDSYNASGDEGEWPAGGELDFWETYDNRATRTPVQSNIHRLRPGSTVPYTSADDETVQVLHTGIDQSDWHKIVCTWEPELVSIEIDDSGTPVTLTDDPDWIPDWDMELTLQLDQWSNTPPSTPVKMLVDYVLLRDWVAD